MSKNTLTKKIFSICMFFLALCVLQQSVFSISGNNLKDIKFVKTPNNPFQGTSVLFKWTPADGQGDIPIAGYSYELTNNPISTLDSTVDTTAKNVTLPVTASGTYYFRVRAFDTQGNSSNELEYSFAGNLGNSSPGKIDLSIAIAPTDVGTVLTGGTASFVVSSSDSLSSLNVEVRQSGQSSATAVTMVPTGTPNRWRGFYNIVSGFDGPAIVTAGGTDLSGGVAAGSSIFIVDTIAPVADITVTKPGERYQVNLFIDDITDITTPADKLLSYTLDGQTYALELINSGGSRWSAFMPVGFPETAVAEVSFDFSATDRAGNVGADINSGKTYTFYGSNAGGDTTPPEIGIVLSSAVTKPGDTFTITVSSNEALKNAPSVIINQHNDSTVISMQPTTNPREWFGSYTVLTGPECIATVDVEGVDLAGNSVNVKKTFYVDTPAKGDIINSSTGGTVGLTDGTTVQVPPNATNRDYRIVIDIINHDSLSSASANQSHLVLVAGLVREITAYEVINGVVTNNKITDFNLPITITIPYPDANNDGIVDGTDIKETNLKIFYFDELTNSWIPEVDFVLDAQNNTISVKVNHLSIFGILAIAQAASLDNVINYPNPCYLDTNPFITIGNIPTSGSATVYIYNLAGELVRKLQDGAGISVVGLYKQARWDGRNSSGNKCASGLYIYLLNVNGETKKDKIGILW